MFHDIVVAVVRGFKECIKCKVDGEMSTLWPIKSKPLGSLELAQLLNHMLRGIMYDLRDRQKLCEIQVYNMIR